MKKLIRVAGFANGADCPIAGQYLETFDFEADNGRGYGTFTRDPKKAMRFDGIASAFAFWNTQSKTVPYRPYGPPGVPNKPFTATTIEIADEPWPPTK